MNAIDMPTFETFSSIKRTAKNGDEVDATGRGKHVIAKLVNHPQAASRTVTLMRRRNRRTTRQALRNAW